MGKGKKLVSRKTLWTLRYTVSVIIIGVITSVIAGYVVWSRTKDRVEITCKLDGWITIRTLLESDLEELQLSYKNTPVKNVMKVSWRIINTGSKGIEEFETPPSIIYPGKFNIVKAIVSDTSPLLQVDTDASVDAKNRTIAVSKLGVFNEEEFLKMDIYMIDIPDDRISPDYFADWQFIAKSLDLDTKIDTVSGTGNDSEITSPSWQEKAPRVLLLLMWGIMLPILVIRLVQLRQRAIILKEKATDSAQATMQVIEEIRQVLEEHDEEAGEREYIQVANSLQSDEWTDYIDRAKKRAKDLAYLGIDSNDRYYLTHDIDPLLDDKLIDMLESINSEIPLNQAIIQLGLRELSRRAQLGGIPLDAAIGAVAVYIENQRSSQNGEQ